MFSMKLRLRIFGILLMSLIVLIIFTSTASEVTTLQRRLNGLNMLSHAEEPANAQKVPASGICSQTERKNLVHKMCETYPKLNKTVHRSLPKLIVDHKHKVAYCFIEKAGCSSWKTILANVSSAGRVKPTMTLSELRGVHFNIRQYGLDDIPYNDSLSNYTKFMVVRHPLDRLISSYRDKMRGGDVTFNNYAKSVVEQFRTNMSNTDMFPTFQEFISMVLSKVALSYNQHWSKYFYKCDPCNIQYDYLMKIETMDHDMNMFLARVFPKDMKYITERKLNSFAPPEESKTTYKHRFNIFKELSEVQKAGISKLFEHESDFFGYSFNEETLEADCCDKTVSSHKNYTTGCCC